jgi:hypothetical protein
MLAAFCMPALAEDDANEVYESASDALDSMQVEVHPESGGVMANEVISQFFPEVEEDEGTYPASEFLEHDFLLRRVGPAKGSYSGRIYGKYSKDKISGVEKWEKELELDLHYKELDGYFRFSDVNPFAHEKDPFRWEKGQLKYKHRDRTYTAGSFGALFGRGLALNMFEDRNLDFDNEIEGLKIEQEVGNDGLLTVLTGSRKLRDELRAGTVRAARISGPVSDNIELGAHVVEVTAPDMRSDVDAILVDKASLMGADATFRAGDFHGYGEIVGLQRPAVDGAALPWSSGDDGHGYYATFGYGVPGFSLTSEFKYYRHLSQPFSVLPPIRRWIENAAAFPEKDKGYGIDLNWSPADDGSLINLHYAQDREEGFPFTEILSSYSSPSGRDTHWVYENWQVTTPTEKHKYNRVTIDQIINEDWSGTLFVEQHHKAFFHVPEYNVWTLTPEIAYQSKFNGIFTYAFTGQDDAVKKEWKLIELRYRPDEDQEFNVLWGSRMAGFVCSGGVCRPEPEFSGFRVDYLLRF